MTIVGEWWNELGSKMLINPLGGNPRTFTGSYHTAVGTARQRDYDLAGACDEAGGSTQTLGWAVSFDPPDPAEPGQSDNDPTTCAWSAQLQTVQFHGQEIEYITSSWYLTGATDRNVNWTSTNAGKDYFFRQKPTAEMLGTAILP